MAVNESAMLAGPVAAFSQDLVSEGFFPHPGGGTPLDTYWGMNAPQNRLVRHLAIAIGLKLVVLVGLWAAFVRDERVSVDVDVAAAHLSAPVATSGDQP